ncbi:MAG: T9SS type A sorting domain-containing protein [Flavobacteriales bacterium]
MKTLHHLLAAMMLIVASGSTHAQTINCDWFTVTGLAPDTLNVNSTLINIQMVGGFSDFINYPVISSVTDCTGDTVATGGLWFFGQMGGTTQGYPVSQLENDVCLPLTIEFVYGNESFENDTCLLTFDGTNLCELFSITGIEPDSLNPGFSNIQIQMDGDPLDQINYPQVMTVQDCFGDTVSTGVLTFFGQLGQTTQGYQVTALSDNLCFPITVEFFYGDENDFFPEGNTCLLTYFGAGLAVHDTKRDSFSVFPNPTTGEIQLSCHESLTGKTYCIVDMTGAIVLSGLVLTTNARIDVSALTPGVYLLMVDGYAHRVVRD